MTPITPRAGGQLSDIGPEILAVGSGAVLTNYVDPGAVTNFPRRFYRVRQVF